MTMRENAFRYGKAALGPHFTDRADGVKLLIENTFASILVRHIRLHQEVGQGTACFSWQENARDNGVVVTR
jgi:hypothetical protein